MEDKKIEKPTVGQIIELLKGYPLDAPFRIEDADTYEEISIVHHRIAKDGVVWFNGEYGEMRPVICN